MKCNVKLCKKRQNKADKNHFLSQAVEWTQERTLYIIELWEQNPCLYDPRNEMYHNKHARYDALKRMVDSLSLMSPNFTISIEEVKQKLNNLRSQYHHEIEKIKKSGKSGAGTDDLYESSAYWFPSIQFLKNFVKPKKGKSNFEVLTVQAGGDRSTFSENISYSSQNDMDDIDTHEDFDFTPPSTSNRKRKKSPDSQILTEATDALRSLTSSMTSANTTDKQRYPSDIEAFGEHVKAEVNKLFCEQLRDEAMHEFSNIMYKIKQKQRNTNVDSLY